MGCQGPVTAIARPIPGTLGIAMNDLRFAVRGLVRSPAFAAVAILTLALGIGASTAIFTVLEAVVLRPLSFPEPDRLVALGKLRDTPRRIPASHPELRDWRERSTSFAGLAGYSTRDHVVRAAGEPRRLPAVAATANLFTVLGVTPVVGRAFAPGEDTPGRSQVTVISYGLWQELGGGVDVVGRTISVDERPYAIVGVAPRGFRFPPRAEDTHLWMPFPATPIDELYREERRASVVRVVGRLAPGVTLATAEAEMRTIGAAIAAEHPRDNAGMTVTVLPLHASMVEDVRGALLLLLGAVAFVLLIACANVANLLLARASTRRRELAIHVALGAGRARIVRKLLCESLVLAGAGGALGVVLAVVGIDALSSLIPPEIRAVGEIALTGRVLAFSAALSLVTAVIFGIAPAWQASSPHPAEALGARSTPHRAARRLRHLLVAGEIAVATVLLVGSSLLATSFARVVDEDPGFEATGLWTAHVPLTGEAYKDEATVQAAYRRLLDAVRAIPGVEHAAVATAMPFLPIDGWTGLWRADGPRPDMKEMTNARFHGVSPGYFATMRTPIRQGRDFTALDDRPDAPLVMIVSQTAARKLFGEEGAVGKQVRADLGLEDAYEIVGVAGDVKGGSLEEAPAIELYVPFQRLNHAVNLAAVVRAPPGADLAAGLRAAAMAADPTMPSPRVQPIDASIGGTLARRKLSTLLLVSFAAGALLLALVGIYGVMSYTVTQQRHEIAIRVAVGATPSLVTRRVVTHALALAAAGVAVGAIAAYALSQLLESLLYRVSTTDPTSFAVAAALQLLVAAAAAWLPARRAARIHPMEVLRAE